MYIYIYIYMCHMHIYVHILYMFLRPESGPESSLIWSWGDDIYIQMYMYMYIYIHTHIHICIYTYICKYMADLRIGLRRACTEVEVMTRIAATTEHAYWYMYTWYAYWYMYIEAPCNFAKEPYIPSQKSPVFVRTEVEVMTGIAAATEHAYWCMSIWYTNRYMYI